MKTKLTKSWSAPLALALLATAFLASATEKKPLNNDDVLTMAKEGLAENNIILAIQDSPANYDVSPVALIALKKQGITPKIQEAMQLAMKPAAPQIPAGATDSASQQRLLNRVFLIDGAQRREMQQNKGEVRTFAAPFIVKLFTRFEGRQAEFRFANNSPVLELALLGNWVPSEHIKLVKPDLTKDAREITIQGMAGPGVPIKMEKKAYVTLTFEELRKEDMAGVQLSIHRIKPTTPLPPGEYVLAVDNAFYCFGIDPVQ